MAAARSPRPTDMSGAPGGQYGRLGYESLPHSETTGCLRLLEDKQKGDLVVTTAIARPPGIAEPKFAAVTRSFHVARFANGAPLCKVDKRFFMMKRHTFNSVNAFALCLMACVNPGVEPDEPDAVDPSETGTGRDISGAPERGGPDVVSEDDGLEPNIDESPALSRILGISDPTSVADTVARTNRFRRLTLDEYDRSVRDLLGFDVGLISNDFPEELATLQGYFARGDLRVSDRLVVELERAAERLAAQAVNRAESYSTIVRCVSQDVACRDEFVRAFGLRTYRRPLSEVEVGRYQTLFDSAAELVASGDPFRDGVQLVVETMLQSPNFLYRVERGTGVSDEVGERIDGYEAASRLSFMLWGSTPDDSLLTAAGAGELSTPEGVAQHARRLVDDPQVSTRVNDYHSRWLQLSALSAGSKDSTLFPEYTAGLVGSMLEETRRFVEEATLVSGGSLTALLTAPYGFVDARLAALYGLEGTFGDELQRVDFGPDDPRGGLLTQAGFLAGHSSASDRTSPILRGVFVLRRLLCQDIPDPPPNAQSTEPPPSETPIVTTRDFFEWKTGMSECRGCHFQINPAGFAFEDFDTIGRHRTEEAGERIDASGALELGQVTLEFEGGKEFSAQIAELPEAQACYARNWLRYLWGRADTDDDLRTLSTIRNGLATSDYGIRELLLDVTESAAFLHISSGQTSPALGPPPGGGATGRASNDE